MAMREEMKISTTYFGKELIAMASATLMDPVVPDIIVRPELGTCYTIRWRKLLSTRA
jgi:hypothetical protein